MNDVSVCGDTGKEVITDTGALLGGGDNVGACRSLQLQGEKIRSKLRRILLCQAKELDSILEAVGGR